MSAPFSRVATGDTGSGGPDGAAAKRLFGPLVWWELTRLARRGHAARSRILLLYGLLLAVVGFAVVWSYPASPARLLRGSADPLPIAAAADFARSLALVLLEAQLLLVALLTPAYAAGAVAEEKDRATLPLLLTTGLTDREIVWGKTAARVLSVLAAVAAGVPVLMLTLLFGGVDVGFLAAGYALTVGTVVLSAGIGVSAGCHAPDTRTALVRAYASSAVLIGGVLVPPFVLLSPFAMLAYYRLDFGSEVLRTAIGFGYPVGQVVIAWALIAEAARGLRSPGPTAGPPSPTDYPEPPRGRPAPVLPGDPPPPPLPPVDPADPVYWKERHTGRSTTIPLLDVPVRLLGGLFAVVAVALFVTGGWGLVKRAVLALDPGAAPGLIARHGPDPPDAAGTLLIVAGTLAAGLYLLPLAVGVTGCVAGERHRGTLDALLATTLRRRGVLRSKVGAHAGRGLALAGGAAAALGAGFGADGGVSLGLAAMAAFAAGVALVVGVGAWASVRSATPVRAFRLCLPAAAAVVALPLVVWNFTTWDDPDTPTAAFLWAAGVCLAFGGVMWWRAEVGMERGG